MKRLIALALLGFACPLYSQIDNNTVTINGYPVGQLKNRLGTTASTWATNGQWNFTINIANFDTGTNTVTLYTICEEAYTQRTVKASASNMTFEVFDPYGNSVYSNTFTSTAFTSVTYNCTNTVNGSSLVGINDAGGYFTATTVEGALQELGPGGTTNATTLAQAVQAGNNADGSIEMGTNKITGLTQLHGAGSMLISSAFLSCSTAS